MGTQFNDQIIYSVTIRDIEYGREVVVGDVSQWYSSSSLTLHLALGCVACHGKQADMWRMSGRDPGKSPVVTK